MVGSRHRFQWSFYAVNCGLQDLILILQNLILFFQSISLTIWGLHHPWQFIVFAFTNSTWFIASSTDFFNSAIFELSGLSLSSKILANWSQLIAVILVDTRNIRQIGQITRYRSLKYNSLQFLQERRKKQIIGYHISGNYPILSADRRSLTTTSSTCVCKEQKSRSYWRAYKRCEFLGRVINEVFMDIWNGVSKNMPKTVISLPVLVDCNGT